MLSTIINLIILAAVSAIGEKSNYLGCFHNFLSNRDESRWSDSKVYDTNATCVTECESSFHRYAMYRKDGSCKCANVLDTSRVDDSLCDIVCSGDKCAEDSSNAVYYTGVRVPGPVRSIRVVEATNTTLAIVWSPPEWPSNDIIGYNVKVDVVRTYSRNLFSTLSMTLAADENHRLYNLQPGTTYNISVKTITKYGFGRIASTTATTIIGEPDPVPSPPIVLERDDRMAKIEFEQAVNDNGPVSAYRVIVVDGNSAVKFEPELLISYNGTEGNRSPPYIAAEIPPFNIRHEFVVGDGSVYGGHANVPLMPGSDVDFLIGVVSVENETTKYGYSRPSRTRTVRFDDRPLDLRSDATIVVGLWVAIALLGTLLSISIVGFLILRHRVRKGRRRTLDCRELSPRGPVLETDNDGYIPDEDLISADDYEDIKRRAWIIPKNFLEVQEQCLVGRGEFGSVFSGTIRKEGDGNNIEVYALSVAPIQKEALRSFNDIVSAGRHDRLVSLIGIQETVDTLYVVLEPRGAVFKETLLESRNRDDTHVTNISSGDMLYAAIDIASAMKYLSTRRIVHGKLCARNVFVDARLSIKVAGHGLTEYYSHSRPDYTRWMAHEVLRRKSCGEKSDIWSFGCLLWEMANLGATPYGSITNQDILDRVLSDTRLQRPSTVGDDLFQLMLFCWQYEPSDRPTFKEIFQTLEHLLSDTSIAKFDFEKQPGFAYEAYMPDFEYSVENHS